MDNKTFEELISAKKLSPYRDYLRRVAKPCVEIYRTDKPPLNHQSRFGGPTFLPPDFSWPAHEQAQYRFLGQINFDEITAPCAMPDKGLLCLFYQFDEDEQRFWEQGFVIGYYWPNTTGFIAKECPCEEAASSCGLEFRVGTELPRRRYLRNDWPVEYDELQEIIEKQLPTDFVESRDHLLGYPFFNSLAYDPTPPNYTSLITISSNGYLNWSWNDGGILMVFIDPNKLAVCDFSDLKTDAG